MKREEEPNPALGWRAIRVSLDRPRILQMQVQSMLRAAKGRPLSVMFPFIAAADEFFEARSVLLAELEREKAAGRPAPATLEIGAMLETPSLAFAPDNMFELADFISIGGNDLKQFFFAADRENERVRRRYGALNASYLKLIAMIVERCAKGGAELSYCGEDAGRPLEALALAAMGLRNLSMRPASIGPVKRMLREVDLTAARAVIDRGLADGEVSLNARLSAWAEEVGAPVMV
jgi:phosphotransferase system enzyme I (PtsP)